MINYNSPPGITQELRNYYKKLGHFDDFNIILAGSFDDTLDQDGKMFFTRGEITKELQFSDLFEQLSFDGINEVVHYVDREWDNIE